MAPLDETEAWYKRLREDKPHLKLPESHAEFADRPDLQHAVAADERQPAKMPEPPENLLRYYHEYGKDQLPEYDKFRQEVVDTDDEELVEDMAEWMHAEWYPLVDRAEFDDKIGMTEWRSRRPSWLNNALRGAGERVLDLAAGGVQALASATKPVAMWLDRQFPLGTYDPSTGTWYGVGEDVPEEVREKPSDMEVAAGLARQTELGYRPRTTAEEFWNDPWSKWVPFFLEQGIVSAPDMAAVLVNLPGYVVSRTGELAYDRTRNDDRDEVTAGEVMTMLPVATASAFMERIGARLSLSIGRVSDQAARKGGEMAAATVGKAAERAGRVLGRGIAGGAGETATEFMQEFTEATATTLGTEKGLDLAEALKAGAIGAAAGGGIGGTLGLGSGTIREIARPDDVLVGDDTTPGLPPDGEEDVVPPDAPPPPAEPGTEPAEPAPEIPEDAAEPEPERTIESRQLEKEVEFGKRRRLGIGDVGKGELVTVDPLTSPPFVGTVGLVDGNGVQILDEEGMPIGAAYPDDPDGPWLYSPVDDRVSGEQGLADRRARADLRDELIRVLERLTGAATGPAGDAERAELMETLRKLREDDRFSGLSRPAKDAIDDVLRAGLREQAEAEAEAEAAEQAEAEAAEERDREAARQKDIEDVRGRRDKAADQIGELDVEDAEAAAEGQPGPDGTPAKATAEVVDARRKAIADRRARAVEERDRLTGRLEELEGRPTAPPDDTGPPPAAPTPTVADGEIIDPATGERISPSTREFRPDELKVDAKRFQFKTGGDQYGVTDRLRDVKKFNQHAAGRIMVWQDRAGEYWVVDGHQRSGLARRLQAENPDADIRIAATVLREADGITDKDARILAAKRNVLENNASVIDIAKLIRDEPDALTDSEISASQIGPGGAVRQAKNLARLGENAFGMAINEIIPMNHAAAVGEMVPDRDGQPDDSRQTGVMSLLAKHKPANENQARSMISDMLAVPVRRETNLDMFGQFDEATPLIVERAKVKDWAEKNLKTHARLFGILREKAAAIEDAGNVLDRGSNQTLEDEARIMLDRLLRSGNFRGPISDALDTAAERLGAGEHINAVGKDFLEDLARAVTSAVETAPEDSGERQGVDEGQEPAADAGAQGAPQAEATAAVDEDAEGDLDQTLQDLMNLEAESDPNPQFSIYDADGRRQAWKKIIASRGNSREAARIARENDMEIGRAQVKKWNRISTERRQKREITDPITRGEPAPRRLERKRRRAEQEASMKAFWEEQDAKQKREDARQDERDAIRETLKSVARIARSMGWDVRSSKDRAGRISSYYLTPSLDRSKWSGPPIRVSDHEIPPNAKRESNAIFHGRNGYDGYHGPELILDEPKRDEWIRRALVLLADNRDVSQFSIVENVDAGREVDELTDEEIRQFLGELAVEGQRLRDAHQTDSHRFVEIVRYIRLATAERDRRANRHPLQGHGLTVKETDGRWLVTGKTFDHRQALWDAGGRKKDDSWAFEFAADPTPAVLEKLGPAPDAGPRARRDDRSALDDGFPPSRPPVGVDVNPDDYVAADTKALLARGEEFGLPRDVISDQITDAAAVVQAYATKKPMFLIASETGSGKTFVMAAAIREMQRRGAKDILYVTKNQNIIRQNQQDLAPFILEGSPPIRFITYASLTGQNREAHINSVGPHTTVIFDESHEIKNVRKPRGMAGAMMLQRAGFPVLMSATPYENPVQMAYLDPTGVFDADGGFSTWVMGYGAVQTRRGPARILEFRGTPEDSARAQEALAQKGVFTYRPTRLPPGMVETDFDKANIPLDIYRLYSRVDSAYATAITRAVNEPGLGIQIGMHRVNTLKRVVEAGKVEEAVNAAKAAIAAGRHPVLFVETKASRHIGRYRRSQNWRNANKKLPKAQQDTDPDRLFTPDEIAEAMSEWESALLAAAAQGEPEPVAPFGRDIEAIAIAMRDAGVDVKLPSVKNKLAEGIGSDATLFTGEEADAQAQANKDAFLAGRKKALIATMAKGGTGLSLHDTVGDAPRTMIGLNLPWSATELDQVLGRVARYGMKSAAEITWLWGTGVPVERRVAARVQERMENMGALVRTGAPEITDKIKSERTRDEIEHSTGEDFSLAVSPKVNELIGKLPPPGGWVVDDTELRMDVMRLVRRLAPATSTIETTNWIRPPDWAPPHAVILGKYDRDLNALTVVVDGRARRSAMFTARHEVIHALRNLQLISPQEWASLKRAAREGKWFERYEIRERYEQLGPRYYKDGQPTDIAYEEAVADAFAHFIDSKVEFIGADWSGSRPQDKSAIIRVFERLRRFFYELGRMLNLYGYESAYNIFERIESGEIGSRGWARRHAIRTAEFERYSVEIPNLAPKLRTAIEKAQMKSAPAREWGRYLTSKSVGVGPVEIEDAGRLMRMLNTSDRLTREQMLDLYERKVPKVVVTVLSDDSDLATKHDDTESLDISIDTFWENPPEGTTLADILPEGVTGGVPEYSGVKAVALKKMVNDENDTAFYGYVFEIPEAIRRVATESHLSVLIDGDTPLMKVLISIFDHSSLTDAKQELDNWEMNNEIYESQEWDMGGRYSGATQPGLRDNYAEVLFKDSHEVATGTTAGSQHFPGHTGLFAFMRTSTRKIGDKKVLLIEEVQSDLHQSGEQAIFAGSSSWVRLAFKQAIDMAVKGGQDAIGWSSGFDMAIMEGVYAEETKRRGIMKSYDVKQRNVIENYAKRQKWNLVVEPAAFVGQTVLGDMTVGSRLDDAAAAAYRDAAYAGAANNELHTQARAAANEKVGAHPTDVIIAYYHVDITPEVRAAVQENQQPLYSMVMREPAQQDDARSRTASKLRQAIVDAPVEEQSATAWQKYLTSPRRQIRKTEMQDAAGWMDIIFQNPDHVVTKAQMVESFDVHVPKAIVVVRNEDDVVIDPKDLEVHDDQLSDIEDNAGFPPEIFNRPVWIEPDDTLERGTTFRESRIYEDLLDGFRSHMSDELSSSEYTEAEIVEMTYVDDDMDENVGFVVKAGARYFAGVQIDWHSHDNLFEIDEIEHGGISEAKHNVWAMVRRAYDDAYRESEERRSSMEREAQNELEWEARSKAPSAIKWDWIVFKGPASNYHEMTLQDSRYLDDGSSEHWNEPGVFSHVRADIRSLGGVYTYFINEMQSDVHQGEPDRSYMHAEEASWTGRTFKEALAQAKDRMGTRRIMWASGSAVAAMEGTDAVGGFVRYYNRVMPNTIGKIIKERGWNTEVKVGYVHLETREMLDPELAERLEADRQRVADAFVDKFIENEPEEFERRVGEKLSNFPGGVDYTKVDPADAVRVAEKEEAEKRAKAEKAARNAIREEFLAGEYDYSPREGNPEPEKLPDEPSLLEVISTDPAIHKWWDEQYENAHEQGRGAFSTPIKVFYMDITPEIRKDVTERPLPRYSMVNRPGDDGRDKAAGLEFEDGDTERRWREASKGVTGPSTLDRVKKNLGVQWRRLTRHREHLVENVDNADVIERLLQLEGQTRGASDEIGSLFERVTKGLGQDDIDLLQRKMVLDDLHWTAERGMDLPYGLTGLDQVEFELEKVNAALDRRPELRKRLNIRANHLDQMRRELIEHGVLPEERLRNRNYFRHMVMEYAEVRARAGGASGKVRTPHWHARRGSEKDINANWFQAEANWLFKAKTDIATMRLLNWLERSKYNRKTRFRQQAKELNEEVATGRLQEEILAALDNAGFTGEGAGRLKAEIAAATSPREIGTIMRATMRVAASKKLDAAVRAMPLLREWLSLTGAISLAFTRWRPLLQAMTAAERQMVPQRLRRALARAASNRDGDDAEIWPVLDWLISQNDMPMLRDASIFVRAAVAKRANWVRDALVADQYINPESAPDLIDAFAGDEDLVAWQPDSYDGKTRKMHVFTAKSVPEWTIEHLHEEFAKWGKKFSRGDITAGVDPFAVAELLKRVREVQAIGGPMKELILPRELAMTLDEFHDAESAGGVDAIARTVTNRWKQWVLFNPYRFAKYYLNNLSGDVDAIIANPSGRGIARKLGAATRMVTDFLYRGRVADPLLIEAIDAGVIHSALTQQEIHEAGESATDDPFIKEQTSRLVAAPKRYFHEVRKFARLRENAFRLAAYLYYREMIVDRGLTPEQFGYGATPPWMITGITEPTDLAARMARDALGDYGNISVTGRWARARVLPFVSWIESNTRRYANLFRNAALYGRDVGAVRGFTAGTMTAAGLLLRIGMFYGLVQAWNNLFFADDEEELGTEERFRLHLNLGRTADGEIRTLRFQGAFSDFAGWFGFEDAGAIISEVEKGRASVGDVLGAVAKAPVNKLAQGVNPVYKLPMELGLGRQFYPDVFSPRAVRDPWTHTARTFSLEEEIAQIQKSLGVPSPTRGYSGNPLDLFTYTREPGQIAYDNIRSKAYGFLRQETGGTGGAGRNTRRSSAMYNLRRAQVMGDDRSAAAAWDRLKRYGVTANSMRAMIRRAHPIGMLNNRQKAGFVATLSSKERDQLARATKWYAKTFRGQVP